MTDAVKRSGADAALVIVPFYNKPGQRGILAHFEVLVQGTDLPLIIHNAPERTVVDASVDTLATFAGYRRIIGVVDHDPSSGRLVRLRSSVPSGFMILAGDDRSGPLHRIMGGDGWLSAAASVLPEHMRELDCVCVQQQWRDMQQRLLALQPRFDALALEPHPATVKDALGALRMSGHVRLPLVMASPSARRGIDSALQPFDGCGLHGDLSSDLHHATRGDLGEIVRIGR